MTGLSRFFGSCNPPDYTDVVDTTFWGARGDVCILKRPRFEEHVISQPRRYLGQMVATKATRHNSPCQPQGCCFCFYLISERATKMPQMLLK